MEEEKCLTQVDEILNHLKATELVKIPIEIRNAIQEKKDKQYKWSYDETKPLEEQKINRKTIAILSYLNMEYLLTKEQKLVMEELHRLNEEKSEKQKREMYAPDNLFQKNSHRNEMEENKERNNMQMLIKQEEVWYKRIFKAILAFFSRDKIN